MQLSFEHVSYTYDAQAARTLQKQQKKLLKRGDTYDLQTVEQGSESVSWALRDVSFCIHEGSFVGIAGHTGSGKSTLLQHMNGLLQPTCGRVLLDGANIAQKAMRKRMFSTVGMVFQYPERQLFAASVYDDVSFGPKNLGLSPQEIEKRVTWALDAVGINEHEVRNKSPFELSGGMQRRVAIAGVLAMRPRMLVLDEPTAGLDPQAKTHILRFVQNLHTQGITIVMASHNMDDLAQLCTNVLVLAHGEIALQGTPEQVFSCAEAVEELGLSLPNAQRVANSLRACGVALPKRLYASPATLAQELAVLYERSKTNTPQ